MTPKDVLAVTALVVAVLLSGAVLVTAGQGRALDTDTSAVIGSLGAAVIAGALGIAIGRRSGKNDKDDPK